MSHHADNMVCSKRPDDLYKLTKLQVKVGVLRPIQQPG